MPTEDLETGELHLYPCTAVRVTEYPPRGAPRHEMGLTYRFDQPVTLAFCSVYSRPEDLSNLPMAAAAGPPPSLTAVMAPAFHPQRQDVAALAHGLWMYGAHGAAVEGWQRLADGRWLYVLVPLWKHTPDTWTPREPDGFRIFTAGYALSSRDSYRWPDPPPVPASHRPPQEGTRVYATQDGTPPPPVGFPPRPTSTEGATP